MSTMSAADSGSDPTSLENKWEDSDKPDSSRRDQDCSHVIGSLSTTTGNDDPEQDSITISYTRNQKIILVLVLTGQFLCNSCVSLPAPFLPKLDETHNINSDLTGWLLGLFALVQLVMCSVFGKAMSHIGLRTTFISGLFFCGGSTAIFGLLECVTLPDDTDKSVDVTYLVLVTVLRVAQGVGSAAFITAAMTLLVTTFPHNATKILSYSETVIGCGIMAGPAMGSGLYKLGGFLVTFSAVGGLMVLVSLIMLCILPHNLQEAEEDGKCSLVDLLSNINITLSLILAINTGIIWASIDPVLEPELRKTFGLTQEISALTFLLLSVSYSIVAPMVGKALDRLRWLDALNVIVFGFTLCGVNFIFMGPSPLFPGLERPLWLLLVTVAILGVSLAFILIPGLELSFSKANTKKDGTALGTSATAVVSGLWNGAYAIGDFVGPTVSGVITEHASFGWTMTTYTFTCLACVLLIASVKMYQCNKKTSTKTQNVKIVNTGLDDEC